MKNLIIIIVTCLMSLTVSAQPERFNMEPKGKPGKFSPEKFQADLEQFIVKEACLTPTESSKFFPLYNEMRRKQRIVFDKQRRIDRSCPATDADCRKAIKESDALEIELKKIQQTYHNKFLSVLSPIKVFKVMKAESNFHRRMLRHEGMTDGNKARGDRGKDKNKGK